MIVFRCDRCNEETPTTLQQVGRRSFDLCDECMDILIAQIIEYTAALP